MLPSAKLYRFIYSTSRLAIIIGLFFYFYYAYQGGKFSFDQKISINYLSLTTAILLFLVNYFLEAYKWFLLNTEHKTLNHCIKSVFTGSSISLLMPFKWMNFLGWAYHSKPKQWRKLMWSTFPSAFAQNVFTLLFTLLFLPPIFLHHDSYSLTFLYYLLAAILVLFSVVFYFNFFLAPFKIELFSAKLKIQSLGFSRSVLWKVLGTSFARYLVFVGQYLLLFNAFNITLDIYSLIIGSCVTMGLTSFFPVSLLGKIGIRETIALTVFGVFTHHLETQIMTVTLSIWAINVLLPAVIGVILVATQHNYWKHAD